MAAKPKVFLNHNKYGNVQVKNAGWLAVSGEKFLLCKIGDDIRKLLADPIYWTSAPKEVETAFKDFSHIQLDIIRKQRAADHELDRIAAKDHVSSNKLAHAASAEMKNLHEPETWETA